MNVLVVGGGPSGMMASIVASKNNNVTLIERNNELGKKLKLTGGGRCNITNNRDIEDFFDKVVNNKKFLYSSFYSFTNLDLLSFFDKNNLKYKIETDNDHKVYTKSDKAEEVIEVLENALTKNNVKILYNKKVTDFIIEDNVIKGVVVDENEKIMADKVIVATGGKSYPKTGSDGSMHKILKKYHTITNIYPALIPLVIKEEFVKSLQGISIKNVCISTKIKKKKISLSGDMIFTHFGISGPCVLKFSSHITKALSENEIIINIDFLPNMNKDEITNIIKEDKNKNILTNLKKILPQNFLKVILDILDLNDKKAHELSNENLDKLIQKIKNLELTVTKTKELEASQVTSGGISVKEINPSTLKSKIIDNLYFCGEVIDVDAETGGYNLQIAFSTGFLAGSLL